LHKGFYVKSYSSSIKSRRIFKKMYFPVLSTPFNVLWKVYSYIYFLIMLFKTSLINLNSKISFNPLLNLATKFATINDKKKSPAKKSFLLDFGYVESVGSGIAIVKGLLDVRSGELVFFYPNNVYGLTLTLANERVGIVLCCDESKVSENDIVSRTGTRMSVIVGYELLGTVVNPLGFQLGGDIKLKNLNLKKAPITPKIPGIIDTTSF